MDSLKAKLKEMTTLENAVREHINTHRYQDDLIQDKSTWNQICSSLDVLGDSVLAIGSYVYSDFPEDDGLKYIYVYGLLQLLFVQQDAMKHLSDAFELEYKRCEVLIEIRELRNSAIGHPTNQKGTFFNFISRISMSKSGFNLMTCSVSNPYEFKSVNFIRIINVQLDEIIKSFKSLSENLEEIDQMHKEKFKESHLRDIFHSSLDYCLQKIAEGIYSESPGKMNFGHENLNQLREIYQRFEDALRERNEMRDHNKYELTEYRHAIDKLENYFTSNGEEIDELDANIYHYYLCEKNNYFVQIAEEIDESYEE